MQIIYNTYCKDKLDLYAVSQHNVLVSSNSPEKDLDLARRVRAFFLPRAPAELIMKTYTGYPNNQLDL
jgi:hypothetical protein